jgi:hypothetical protein
VHVWKETKKRKGLNGGVEKSKVAHHMTRVLRMKDPADVFGKSITEVDDDMNLL